MKMSRCDVCCEESRVWDVGGIRKIRGGRDVSTEIAMWTGGWIWSEKEKGCRWNCVLLSAASGRVFLNKFEFCSYGFKNCANQIALERYSHG